MAQRLREAGMYVIGMGENKTPKPFRTACDAFKILEVIAQESETSEKDIVSRKDILENIRKIIIENANNGRITDIGEVGNILQKTYSDFDVRNYGYSKLLTFLQSLGDFNIEKIHNGYKISDKAGISLDDIEKFVSSLITENGGSIDNLSLINDEIKKKFPSFDTKQYGFSRFSKFIGSFESFGVVGNSVRPKKKEAVVKKINK